MNLIEHLEHYLGKISEGWRDRNVNNRIQVVCFKNKPFEDIVTYSTVGLSNFELSMNNGRAIRQELVCTAYRNFDGERIASFLSTFAESIISLNRALLRGDVIGPSAPIIFGSLLNSVYIAVPMIFDDGLFVLEDTVPETVFPWIIPVLEEEANYVRSNGWSKFEDLLERKNPELWDLHRASIV